MNKHELIKKLKRLRDAYPADDSHEGVRQGLMIAIRMIDQLDELKVLSQEWIDNNVVHVRGLGDIFEAVAVESLLVPKKELLVKIKFVVDMYGAGADTADNALEKILDLVDSYEEEVAD